jgi:peptide/nickel transport system permease protein
MIDIAIGRDHGQPGDVIVHLVLPAAALTLSLIGAKFLVVRSTVASALGQDFMVLAVAKGLPERLLRYRHAGRNACCPSSPWSPPSSGWRYGGRWWSRPSSPTPASPA